VCVVSPSGCSHLDREDGSITGVDPGRYYIWVFCNLVMNLETCTGPTEGFNARW